MKPVKNVLPLLIILLCPKLFANNHQFSLISCNVLFQGHYFKHAKTKMLLSTRTEAFKKILSNINDPDIICFQEWPHDKSSKQYKGFSNALNHSKYTYLSDNQLKKNKGDGLLTGYNTSTFTKVAVHTKNFLTSGATDKTFLALQLKHKASGYIVGIVNAHLKGGMPHSAFNQTYTKDKYLDFRIAQLKEIEDYIKEQKNVESWIICGDFNPNIASGNKKSYDLFRQNVLTKWLDSDPAGQNKSEYTPITTAVVFNASKKQNEFQRLDYCFYTGNLAATKPQLFPNNRHHLIKHQKDANVSHQKLFYDDYFSDHALIDITFTLTKKKIAQKETGLQQALSKLTTKLKRLAQALKKKTSLN